MFGGILGSTIVTQHPRDLKTSFLRFSRDFQHRFEISTLRFSSKFSVFENLSLLGHFFGRYLSPGCRNVTGKPGFVLFRSSRYILQKISSKNIKFSKSYRPRHFGKKCRQKCLLTFEMSSQPRGDIHVFLCIQRPAPKCH